MRPGCSRARGLTCTGAFLSAWLPRGGGRGNAGRGALSPASGGSEAGGAAAPSGALRAARAAPALTPQPRGSCAAAGPGEGGERAAGRHRRVKPGARRGRRREGLAGARAPRRADRPGSAPSRCCPRPPRFHFTSRKACAVVSRSRRHETSPWLGFGFEKTLFPVAGSCRSGLPSPAHETSCDFCCPEPEGGPGPLARTRRPPVPCARAGSARRSRVCGLLSRS